MNQGMFDALLRRQFTPGKLLFFSLTVVLQAGCELDHSLGGIGPAIKDYVFHMLSKRWVHVFVDTELTRIDDAHGHASAHGMIEKNCVNGLAGGIIPTEGKAHIRDTPRDFCVGQVCSNPACRLNEIDGVAIVFFNTSGNGKDIGIKNNVFGRKAH